MLLRFQRKPRIFTICSGLSVLLIILFSCKKTDSIYPKNELTSQHNNLQFKSFFDNVDLSDPTISKIVTKLKTLNLDYLNKFANTNGYPVWDKVQLTQRVSKRKIILTLLL